MNQITVTIEQLRKIFDDGRLHGEKAAAAWEWGAAPSESEAEAFWDAVFNNIGVHVKNPDQPR